MAFEFFTILWIMRADWLGMDIVILGQWDFRFLVNSDWQYLKFKVTFFVVQ
jgi:hypothetical protein